MSATPTIAVTIATMPKSDGVSSRAKTTREQNCSAKRTHCMAKVMLVPRAAALPSPPAGRRCRLFGQFGRFWNLHRVVARGVKRVGKINEFLQRRKRLRVAVIEEH